MTKQLSPKNDFVFQKMFGTEENKDLLLALLNAILQLPPEKLLTDLTVISAAKLDKERLEDKSGILDIKAQTLDGSLINVEIQLLNQYNMEKRTLFYWSRLFAGQLEKGQNYTDLKKTITINILDFHYLTPDDYHNVYHLREDSVNHLLTDVLEIHFIELPKFFKKELDWDDSLHRWLLLIGQAKEEVLQMLETKDTHIAKAVKVLQMLSCDPETVRLSELREKAIWDEVSRINGARAEGRSEGLAEGHSKGLTEGHSKGLTEGQIIIAGRMLSKGIDVAAVAEMTGLPLDKVRQLQNN